MQLSKFESWLKARNASYLTIKNYSSQIANFGDKDISFLPQYLSEMPVPMRKYAIKRYLEFLQEKEPNTKDYTTILAQLKPISVHQEERKSTQTLERKRGKEFIKHLLELDKKELALICMIIYDTGVRIRAVLRMRKRDIEIVSDETNINFNDKRKKKITRLISDSTKEHLLGFTQDLTDDSYLFFKKEKISDEDLDEKYWLLWSDIKTESRKFFGKIGVSFHWLRRGSALDIYESTGNDLVAASEHLGHSGTDMTRLYLKVQAEKAREVIRNKKDKW